MRPAASYKCCRFSLFIVVIMFLECFLLEILFSAALSEAVKLTVSIDVTKIQHKINERFLSNTLSPNNFERNLFNLSSPKVRTLAKHLAPAYGRFGGTPANYIIFNPVAGAKHSNTKSYETVKFCTEHKCTDIPTSNYTLTGKDLDSLLNFTKDVGWRLIFDLNDFLRNGTAWDSANAKELLRYVVKHNYSSNMDFELGNEPNAYKHENRSIPGELLAKDFYSLNLILRNDPEFKNYFTNSLLIGPDVTQPFHDSAKILRYLQRFLNNTKLNTLNAITWHEYYENKRYVSPSNFTDPKTLGVFPKRAREVQNAITESGFGEKKVWLGETGSISGKGLEGYTNGFANGFLWLDKLGQAAQLGIELVMQSTFLDGKRCLVEIKPPYNPLPSYWLSLLHKILVGQNVFNTTSHDTTEKLRVYAHCTNSARSGYKPGTVVIMVINLHNSLVHVVTNLQESAIDQYLLTPEHDDITSKKVRLNGKRLKMIDDYTIPPLLNMRIRTNRIILPELSYGFFVLPNFQTELCSE